MKGSDLPVRPIGEVKEEVERLCGGAPAPPATEDVPVAIIQWVDGTTIDTVYKVRV